MRLSSLGTFQQVTAPSVVPVFDLPPGSSKEKGWAVPAGSPGCQLCCWFPLTSASFRAFPAAGPSHVGSECTDTPWTAPSRSLPYVCALESADASLSTLCHNSQTARLSRKTWIWITELLRSVSPRNYFLSPVSLLTPEDVNVPTETGRRSRRWLQQKKPVPEASWSHFMKQLLCLFYTGVPLCRGGEVCLFVLSFNCLSSIFGQSILTFFLCLGLK